MVRLILVSLYAISIYSCDKIDNTYEHISIKNYKALQSYDVVDTMKIDLSRSSIKWKGTKMKGLGKHEGYIGFENAYFLCDQDKITGGQLIVDMTSLSVTDIPEHEFIPIRNLNNHLKSEDFFDVMSFPISTFDIRQIEYTSDNTLRVNGYLTIKNITNPISMIAIQQDNTFKSVLRFDRFDYNISYEGNWIEKTLVDREVELSVAIYLH